MILREYQSRASDSIIEAFQSNRSTLLSMATGLGKTVIFSDVIRRFQPKRVMVLAHREELIAQAAHKIQAVTGIKGAVEMANQQACGGLFGESSVVVSTIQTQIAGPNGGRMTKFKPDDFGLLIIDESHRAPAPSYRKVIKHYQQNPNLKLLGVTATPDRLDQLAMGEVFDSVAFEYGILDGINDGYLVPIEQQMITIDGLDYSHVKITGGDLNNAELAAIMEEERVMQGVASAVLQTVGNKRTLIFTASVRQAEILAAILNRHRAGMADWASGESDKDERKELLRRFANGDLQIVVNCALFVEGYDNPAVEVVVMATATKSRAKYTQAIGRGTRPLPGVIDPFEFSEGRKQAIENSAKASLVVLDFCGNAGRHKLVSTADILAGKHSQEVVDRAKEAARKADGSMRMVELLAHEEEELRKRRETEEARRLAEAARKAHLIANAKFSRKVINAFDVYDMTPASATGKNLSIALTNEEREILISRFKLDPDGVPLPQGHALVEEFRARERKGLCTPGQIKQLRIRGIDTANLSKANAGRIIGAIAAAGWPMQWPVPKPALAPQPQPEAQPA